MARSQIAGTPSAGSDCQKPVSWPGAEGYDPNDYFLVNQGERRLV